MKLSKQRMKEMLHNDRFPRSARYDPAWVLKGWMGPNVLWLAEWLGEVMDIKPEMRVLDLGCGKALSSIFFAREYGATVWADDLWIPATENWQRVREVGLQDNVYPIYAEAHALPYAGEFFDAVVSLDSYQYFGTDDLYLGYLLGFLRPGGQIGIVVPGLVRDFDGPVPEHLTRVQSSGIPFWQPECACFHTADWWRHHWERSELVDVAVAEVLPDGWRHWLQYERACREAGTLLYPSEEEAIEADAGRNVALIRVVATKKE